MTPGRGQVDLVCVGGVNSGLWLICVPVTVGLGDRSRGLRGLDWGDRVSVEQQRDRAVGWGDRVSVEQQFHTFAFP